MARRPSHLRVGGALSSSLGVCFWLDSAVCAASRKDG
nr:MAG TPA: hypothetical protein [Caudoviricetes sp.]